MTAFETCVRERISQPIAEKVGRVGRAGRRLHREAELSRGEGDAGHLRAEFPGEDAGGCPIAAARIADTAARFHLRETGDEIDQLPRRLFGRIFRPQPEAVVDVFAPDLAVEMVEIIVVIGDRVGAEWQAGFDQAGLLIPSAVAPSSRHAGG